MATSRVVSLRLSLEGAQELKAKLEATGDTGSAALTKLRNALEQIDRSKGAADTLTRTAKAAADTVPHVDRFAASQVAAGNAGRISAQQIAQLTPQLNDLATQLATGGSLFTAFAQQAGQITPIFGGVKGTIGAVVTALGGPLGAAAAAAGAAVLAVGVAAQSSATHMSDLRQSLRLTSTDYAALAEQVDASARRVAATSVLTRGGAEEIGKAIAGSRYLGEYRSQLDDLTKAAADFARVAGVDGAQAGQHFRDAIDAPAKEAEKLAQIGLPAMNTALLETVRSLDASGKSAQATALVLEAMRKGTIGSTADVSSLSTALTNLGNQFTSLTGQKEGWTKFWTDFLAYPIEGLATLAGGLTKARDAILAVKDALGQTGTSTSPGTFGAATTDAALKAVPEALQPHMAAAATRFGLDPAYLASIYSLEAVPDGRGGYVVSPKGARGAMQVMPDTFTELAGRYGIQGSANDLGANMMAAAAYLRELLDKYHDPKVAAIGYNGGPGRADAYLRGGSIPDEAATYGRNIASIYSGTGIVGPSAGRAGASAPGITMPVQDVSAPRAFPRSVTDLLNGGNDGTVARTAQEADERISKLVLAIGELDAAGQHAGPEMDRLQAMLAKARGEFAGAIDPIQGVTRGMQDQLAPLQAQSGAARTVAEALNQVTLAARQAGRDASPAEIAAAQGAALEGLTGKYRDNVSAIERQIAAQDQIAEAYRKSGGSVIEATARTQAEASARETAIPGTAAYAEQVGVLTAKNVQLAASQNALGAIQQNRGIEDEIAYTQRQAATIGMNTDARNRELAVLKVSQEEHRKYGDILPRESEERIRLTGVLADNTIAYAHQQQVINDVTGGISGMVDQVGTSLVDALTKGEASGVSFNSVLQGLVTSAGSLVVKLGLVNEVLNAIDGGSRTTLGLGSLLGLSSGGNTAGGLLGALFGGSGSSGGGFLAGALGLAGSFFGGKPSALSGPDTLAVGGAAKDFASAGAQQVASSAASYSGLYGPMPSASTAGGWTEDARQIATVTKGLDWLSGGKLVSGFKDAIGYQAGQSIGAYVSSVIGEATQAAGPGAAAASNFAGIAAAGAGSQAGSIGSVAASSTAANIVGSESIGTIGLATNTIAEALPYIGTAITVVTDLIQGNYRGAGLVAGGAVIGGIIGSVVPGIGTAIGAGVGAAIGGLADMLLPNHPKNPYLGIDIVSEGGQLGRGEKVNQLTHSTEAFAALGEWEDNVNKYMQRVGIKIANPDGRIANYGQGITGLDQLTKFEDVVKRLDFANADPNDTSNFGVAKGALSGKRFDTLQALNDYLVQIGTFSDNMDALGIHVSKVGSDLKQIEIGSVDGEGLSNLRTALAHDLPGKTFDTQQALQDELNRVNDFVNGTMPSLLNPVFKTASETQKGVQAIYEQYQAAEAQAQSYGLAIGELAQAADVAVQKYIAPAVLALQQQDQGIVTRGLRAAGGAENGQRADLIDYDVKAEQELSAYKKSLTDVYSDAYADTAEYAERIVRLEDVQGAERLSIIQKWGAQAKAALEAVTSGTMNLWARLAKAGGNGLESDLITFDQNAVSQRLQRADQLKAAFGNGVLDTAGGQQEMEFLETVLRAEKANIYKQYEAAAAQARGQVDDVIYASRSAALRATGNADDAKAADLADFDQSASRQRAQLDAYLAAAYGDTIRGTQGYVERMTELEGSLGAQRLAIANKAAAAVADAEKAARDTAMGNVTSLFGSLSDYVRKLQTGADSPLSPNDQYALASSQFNAVSGAAAAGDATSAGKLTSYADALLGASRDIYGSGAGYASDASRVLDAIQNVTANPDALTQNFMRQQTREVTSRLDALNAAIAAVEAAVAATTRELRQQGRAMALAA